MNVRNGRNGKQKENFNGKQIREWITGCTPVCTDRWTAIYYHLAPESMTGGKEKCPSPSTPHYQQKGIRISKKEASSSRWTSPPTSMS